jgi:hypothetical protein
LWTLHPRYLDRQGLVAVWREGLLAQAVLQGRTRGYQNHPQLDRFRAHPEPLRAIGYYLYGVHQEALARGYNFDLTKMDHTGVTLPIQTASGQLAFEVKHLLHKLQQRSKKDYERLAGIESIDPHPLFEIVPGDIEDWEKGNKDKRIITN